MEDNARAMLSLFQSRGYTTHIVMPPIEKRFYVQILGRGLPPIRPSTKGRWCTRSLKVDPMKGVMERYFDGTNKMLMISGVRMGESSARDASLQESQRKSLPIQNCSTGGECGLGLWLDTSISNMHEAIPLIVHWSECKVYDWLIVHLPRFDAELGVLTKKVYGLYNPSEVDDAAAENMRFGCLGCPAVSKDKILEKYASIDPRYEVLKELYGIWNEMWASWHRLWKPRKNKTKGRVGPLKMESRRMFFGKIIDIQARSGIELISEEEIACIKGMWERNVWPKGWTGDEVGAEQIYHALWFPKYETA